MISHRNDAAVIMRSATHRGHSVIIINNSISQGFFFDVLPLNEQFLIKNVFSCLFPGSEVHLKALARHRERERGEKSDCTLANQFKSARK